MTDDDPAAKAFSLKRWSQRKLAAARAGQAPAPSEQNAPANPVPAETPTVVAPSSGAPALPPVESLTIDSDFSGYFQPKVDEILKRQALKQLIRDPRFNVMDGLDVYVGDYSQPDPISPEIVREMVQGRYVFNPPQTRVNDEGVVEDVPPDEAAVIAAAGSPPLPEAAPAPLPEPAPAQPESTPPEIQPVAALPSSVKPDGTAQ
jgi:hypothetical protein